VTTFYNHREMRCVLRALALAALLAVASCSHPRDSVPIVAEITAITAPDTVHADETFAVVYHAILGGHSAYVLDHVDTLRTNTNLAVRIWSRDASHGGCVLWILREDDFAFAVCASGPGQFGIVGCQPDGRDTLKTITVLP